MRVARGLEQPDDKPEIFTDESGKPATEKVVDNAGVTGQYVSSEGLKGDAVWGTRGRWTLLSGTVDGEPVTLAILDHPSNPGFPTYWHARGYGLFAANPLGESIFTEGKKELNLTLEPRQSTTFRYRVLILGGSIPPADIEKEYVAFARYAAIDAIAPGLAQAIAAPPDRDRRRRKHRPRRRISRSTARWGFPSRASSTSAARPR